MNRAATLAYCFVGVCLIIVALNWDGLVTLAVTHRQLLVDRMLVHFVAAPLVAGFLALLVIRIRANRHG